MKFSNERYAGLSPSDVALQRIQLAEVRHAHHQQLHESGTANRVMHSLATTNLHSDKTPPAAGTIFYPFRRPLSEFISMQGGSIYPDARIKWSLHGLPDTRLSVLGNPEAENYVYFLRRHEPLKQHRNNTGYAAGLALDQKSAEGTGRQPYIPFNGVRQEDLILIQSLLSELAGLAVQNSLHSLQIIDPVTLAEGNGQILSYD